MPPSTLTVGIVGVGRWGHLLATAVTATQACRLDWLCDHQVARAVEAADGAPGARATDDLDDLLGAESLAAVVVATPADTHAAVALAAISAGKHVLVEKPMAASLAATESVAAAAERAGVTLACDHTYCHAEAVRELATLLSSGAIGEPQTFEAVRVTASGYRDDADVLWDLAVHELAVLDVLLPGGLRARAVDAEATEWAPSGLAAHARLELQLTCGATVRFKTSWPGERRVRRFRIDGSHGTLEWDDEGREELRIDSPRLVRTTRLPHANRLVAVLRDFADAVALSRPPLAGAATALRVAAVLDAAGAALYPGKQNASGRPRADATSEASRAAGR